MKRKGRTDLNGFEEWGGYMEAKKNKLIEQFNIDGQKSGLKQDDLFKDISIFVNGYTEPSSDELRLLMMKHGGTYHHYYQSGKTTHVIASNLPDSKIKQMNQLKVVKPTWITDSIKAGYILKYQDYLLLTNQSKTQPTLTFCTNGKQPDDTKSTNIKCTTDEHFLEEFYSKSRLHHISSLGSMLKEHILKLRLKKPYTFPGREELTEKAKDLTMNDHDCIEKNVIMHIDMDCFFVSVGIRNRPELKGKPVAVTHSKGNCPKPREGINPMQEVEAYRQKKGLSVQSDHWVNQLKEHDSMAEIASCSYEARQAGIKNGMFVGEALKLCPNLNFISYNFDEYKEVSYILYNTVTRYSLDIEAVSCDEMYADCSELLDATGLTPMQFATVLRTEIKEKTGCPCSVGFGENKLLARLATKKAKPDGQFHLTSDHVESYLSDIAVSDLPGVGRTTSFKLRENGVLTCGDLRNISLFQLQKEFGNKQGETLYNACRGKVDKGLVFDHVRKSVSADVNYGIRFTDDQERDIFLRNLSQEVSNRLEAVMMKGRSITLKLMVKSKEAPEETAKYLGHGVCDTVTKGTSLSIAIYDKEAIYREVQKIIKPLKINSKDLRGIGIKISSLEPVKNEANNIMRFFNSKSTTKNKVCLTKDNSSAETIPKDIDTQENILKDSDLQIEDKKNCNNQTKNNICSGQNRTNKKDLTKSGVSSFVSPTEIRVLLQQWVNSEKKPKQKDKLMIIEYFQQLVNNRRFEELHVLLKSFHRCISRSENFKDTWISVFTDVLDSVQTAMVYIHKSRLKINCSLLKCTSLPD
ncbi:DNA repair protein REV1 isoform X2 [Cimex lectularius]|uniref:DNA repair protein REV1 n=1 Tax=Cimex lectularius TaxID=79782 RepID=A0A8I6RPM2_CIMLE|nr:DNA repair protein REV1 isoform X1 [Cimex lectularius]XP_014250190.1 DNA repair protein REV1 isoform X2 [Cimex lectularius]